MHTQMHAYIYTYTCTQMYIYIYICTYAHMHIHIDTCTHTHTHTHIYTYVYTLTHTYIRTHTHTHIYIYIYIWRSTQHSPKLQHYWSLTIRLFYVISGILFGRVLPLCRDAVSVYYSFSQMSPISIMTIRKSSIVIAVTYAQCLICVVMKTLD